MPWKWKVLEVGNQWKKKLEKEKIDMQLFYNLQTKHFPKILLLHFRIISMPFELWDGGGNGRFPKPQEEVWKREDLCQLFGGRLSVIEHTILWRSSHMLFLM